MKIQRDGIITMDRLRAIVIAANKEGRQLGVVGTATKALEKRGGALLIISSNMTVV